MSFNTERAAALVTVVEEMRYFNLPTPVSITTPVGASVPMKLQFDRGAVEAVDKWGRFAITHTGSVVDEMPGENWVSYSITGDFNGHTVKAWCSVDRTQVEAVS